MATRIPRRACRREVGIPSFQQRCTLSTIGPLWGCRVVLALGEKDPVGSTESDWPAPQSSGRGAAICKGNRWLSSPLADSWARGGNAHRLVSGSVPDGSARMRATSPEANQAWLRPCASGGGGDTLLEETCSEGRDQPTGPCHARSHPAHAARQIRTAAKIRGIHHSTGRWPVQSRLRPHLHRRPRRRRVGVWPAANQASHTGTRVHQIPERTRSVS
jgi:hypothetical protein